MCPSVKPQEKQKFKVSQQCVVSQRGRDGSGSPLTYARDSDSDRYRELRCVLPEAEALLKRSPPYPGDIIDFFASRNAGRFPSAPQRLCGKIRFLLAAGADVSGGSLLDEA